MSSLINDSFCFSDPSSDTCTSSQQCIEEYYRIARKFIDKKLCLIPYAYKFSRDVIFAIFASNLLSTKIKSLKFYKTIPMHIEHKSWKTLDFDHLRRLRPSKNCTYTVSSYWQGQVWQMDRFSYQVNSLVNHRQFAKFT